MPFQRVVSKSVPPSAAISVVRSLAAVCLVAFACIAQAQIPSSERRALIDLYNSADGADWTANSGWNGAAGTECTWYGITCDAGNTTVVNIDLYHNNLVGMLSPLTFTSGGGSSQLSGLTNLQEFDVSSNQLTGSIPALGGLSKLQQFDVDDNQLTGSIPQLTGLNNLQDFNTRDNQLTGTIPSLQGLSNLEFFDVANNQLTGPIPSLIGLSNLVGIHAFTNQLSGPIPSLGGLTKLQIVEIYNNNFTGSIPLLTGLSALQEFYVHDNQLAGSIPAFAGLASLRDFDASDNQLSGPIPSLANQTAWNYFKVGRNALTGGLPTAPASLAAGESIICPNPGLTQTDDAAWDAATGATPWYQGGCGVGTTLIVTPSNGTNGSLSPGVPQTVNYGAATSFTATPIVGYRIAAVAGCGGTLSGNVYTTGPTTADCTVTATFSVIVSANPQPASALDRWAFWILLASLCGVTMLRRLGHES